MVAQAGIDWCEYCSVIPRHPCTSKKEAATCPNATFDAKEFYRSSLPGYSQDEADELAAYRKKYGPLRK